ncbi:MAG: SH3 domain-containing protein [Gemmatimonadota bacterium]|nr:SH3 domain-containing protein [Gemmatimonadota bacterium]
MKTGSRLKRLLLFLPAFLLLFQAQKLPAQELPGEMVVTNRYANIRKGPGTGYGKIATLYQGDHLKAELKYRNWLRVVIADGQVGWIRDDLAGPYKENDRALTNEEADSLKALTDSGSRLIGVLEDSVGNILGRVRGREQQSDSLLNTLGLDRVPPQDSLMRVDEPGEKHVSRFSGRGRSYYLEPFAGFRVFSGRFALERAAVLGVRTGCRLSERFALEALTGFISAGIKDNQSDMDKCNAFELAGRVLFYPLPSLDIGGGSEVYILAGGGTMCFTGRGRPPFGTNGYGFFLYGGGMSLGLGERLSLGGELTHSVFPGVAETGGLQEIGSASSLCIIFGLNYIF